MTPWHFLILALATWRISSLFVNENGPWNLFQGLRTRVGISMLRLDDKPEYYKAVPDTFFANLLDCVWCCSVWCGAGWVVAYLLLPSVTVWVALPFAVSAFAIWVESVVGEDD